MTNPGQSTPWAKLPIPSEGKIPDVPVDLAALADPLDTLLKNVIGGAAAPTGPLSPSLVDASASIGSLNATQSTQQSQITTLQGQVSALSAAPWAVATKNSAVISIQGSNRSRQTAHSYQVPAFSQRRLLIAYGTMIMGWSDTSTAAARGVISLRPDGSTTYGDRNYAIAKGNRQTMSLFFLETVEAGKSPRVALQVEMYDSGSSSSYLEPYEVDPRLYLLAIPYSGSAVPYLPPQ
ncbi:hypothetical protein [Streptomyces sp. NPDC001089]